MSEQSANRSILQDVSPAAMTQAIERNTEGFLLDLGQAGGGEERLDSELRWTIGGSPIDYHNCVVAAALTPEAADEAIVASKERMAALGVPGSWHVGPWMRPDDLGDRLKRHGFSFGGEEVGMAADLQKLSPRPQVANAVGIERVRDRAELTVWTKTLAGGFGAGPHEALWVGEQYEKLGLADEGPWRHYLARVDGTPVATTTMYFGAGVAGIYFVFTLPDWRRRGVGAAITWAALDEARTLGFRVGVLGASTMGESVYRNLGFAEYCRIAIYEWPGP